MMKLAIKMDYQPHKGERYHLNPEKTIFWEKVKRVLYLAIFLPLNVVQLILGRFFSYIIFDPIFRQSDKSISWFTQNTRYPDHAFSDEDDFAVIDILPKRNYLLYSLSNWIHQLKSKWNEAIAPQFNHHLPVSMDDPSKMKDKILEKLDQALSTQLPNGSTLKPHQIHIKGLYYLTPEQRECFFQEATKKYRYDFKNSHQYYNYFSLKTEIGDTLDSIEVRTPKVTQQPIEERTFIIFCTPRQLNYNDFLKQHRYVANQLDTTVIGFNYRGTGHSRGIIANQYDMQDDVLAQVKRLLALGAKPENIALTGECLGANIATAVAAKLHRENCPVKLFNMRSFRSLPALVFALIWPNSESSQLKPFSWLGILFLPFICLVFIPLLYISGWDLTVEKDYLSIPAKDKGFLAVRSKKDSTGQYSKDDPIVSHTYASIYSLVKEEQIKLEQKKQTTPLTPEEHTRLNDKRGEHKFHVNREMRKDACKVDGHACQLRYLKSTKAGSTDARDYMVNFFKKQWHSPELIEAEKYQLTLRSA